MGVHEKLPELPEEPLTAPIAAGAPEQAKPVIKSDTLTRGVGLLAVLSLVVIFIMAIRVAVSGQDVYDDRFTTFKNVNVVLTVIYFVSSILWIILKDKAEKRALAAAQS